MSIILFGFKGSGKTFLGSRLAHLLERPFVDTDLEICKTYKNLGSNCREIYQKVGEKEFRNMESHVLRQISIEIPSVIALGGGVVLDPENVMYLQSKGILIYLRLSFERVLQRIMKNPMPGFVCQENPIDSLKMIYNQRLTLYASIDAKCLHLDPLTDEQCEQALLDVVKGIHGE